MQKSKAFFPPGDRHPAQSGGRRRARSLGEAGYSIAELMTGIAFLLILGLVALPSLSAMINGVSLNGTAREVLGELQRARAEAIMRNIPCRVQLDDQGELALFRYSSAELRWEEKPVAIARLGEGASLSVDATGDVVFAPNGTAPSQATIIVSAPDGRSKSIVVGPAGNVRIL